MHIDGPLYVERLGYQGRPMVFIHPMPLDLSSWLYQMARFSTWFRTIGIDVPGFGRSPSVQPPMTMREAAQACWDAVDRIADEPAVLVGSSVGSNTILHMAQLRPERTLAMIHTGCGYLPVKEFAPRRIAQYNEQGIALRREHAFFDYSPTFQSTDLARYFVDMFVERNDTSDAPTIVEMLRALGEPDPDWLFDVHMPMLIITGGEDGSHKAAFALQARVKDCELVTIEGAGHACNMEKPWEWDRHALDFLARHGLMERP